MKRFLIMSIALVSLLAMGSPAMADHVVVANQGNSAAATKANHKDVDVNCRGDRASLFVIANGGLGTGMKLTGEDLTDLIAFFFNRGATHPDCTDLILFPLP